MMKLILVLLLFFVSTKSFLTREEPDDDGSIFSGKSPCNGGRYMQQNDDNPNIREPCDGRVVQEVIFVDIEEEKGNNLLPSGRYNFGMSELPDLSTSTSLFVMHRQTLPTCLFRLTSFINHHLEQDTFTCNPVPDTSIWRADKRQDYVINSPINNITVSSFAWKLDNATMLKGVEILVPVPTPPPIYIGNPFRPILSLKQHPTTPITHTGKFPWLWRLLTSPYSSFLSFHLSFSYY